MKLNPAQKQAVTHKAGPLLIVAGAGTGKTTVITERIKYLIQEKDVDPQHIFATSFTHKSAEEMLKRLDTVMPLGYRQPWLGTFHSLCERLLRQEGLEIGLNPSFTVMTATDQWLFIKKHLFSFDLDYYRPLGNPNKFITALIKFFSRLSDEAVTPHEFKTLVKDKQSQSQSDDQNLEAQRLGELFLAYTHYLHLKQTESVLDFGDLLLLTLQLFQTRPNLLHQFQSQFRHILIDEFQDTNFAQYALMKTLAPPENNPNLMVVGDDDQCLPPQALIETQAGKKLIKDVKPGDQVLSAAGKGYTTNAQVSKVIKTQKTTRLLTFTTNTNKILTITDNHKMFCYVDRIHDPQNLHYVYLMNKRNLGWRIGVTNNLVARIHLERGVDSILAIKACKTDQEARYYEMLYSLKYGIPTTAFSARPGMVITGDLLNRLMKEIDTTKAVLKLTQELNIDAHEPHLLADGTRRGETHRTMINVYLCTRRFSSKTHQNGFMPKPLISHSLILETSDEKVIFALNQHKILHQKAKRGVRVRRYSTNLKTIMEYAQKLSEITGASINEQASLARKDIQSLMAKIMPAKNILPGMYIPVLKGKKLVYDQVTSVKAQIKKLTVYDLEVYPTHNYIADEVAVHNSIFKFRGASVSNILSFKADYSKAQTVVLDQNYRSTQTILDAAYQTIINNNPDRLEPKLNLTKKLKSARPPLAPPSVQKIPDQTLPLEHEIGIFEAPTLEDEIDWTIKTIVDLVTVKGLSYKDIAILARANNHLEPYISALKRAGLPYQLVANSGLFDQDEIKSLILFLKILLDPSDAINLIQLSQSHIFNLNDSLMFTALKTAKQKSTSVWQEIQVIHEEPVAHFIKTILDYQQLAAETPVTELLYRFIEATGYIKPWVQVESVDNQLKIKNLNLFFNHLKRFEATTNDKTIVGFLSVLDLWLEAGENPGQAQIEDIDTITLLTIHSAKGLEFEAVFVCSLITGRFPTTNRRDPIIVPNELIKETLPVGDEHIGEERRLFYVALTRAKQYLYLTYSKDVGGVRKRHPSGFLAETGLPHQTITPPTEPSPLQLVPAIDPKVRFIKQGQYVIDKVSYSQIDTFKACPLKYKYRYLLQIPAKPHHSLSFGRTIHSTLHQYHASEMQGKNLSLEALLSLYDQNFIEDGYDSSEHKKQRYDSGKAALTRYYHAYQKALGQPQLLEQAFRLKLNGVTLVGKIDRIDTNHAGEYEIVDYKTGTPKDQKKVDKDDQLTLYTLAAKEALGLDIQNASLYFLENGGHKVTTTRTPEQVAKAREKLLKDIGVMQSSEFPAKPDPVKCGFCEFSSLCPFAATKKV